LQSSLYIRFNYARNVLFLLSFLVFLQLKSKAQELVYNGGAEMEYWNGWTAVTAGDYWIRGTKITPHGGSYFFFPNQTINPSSEIFQDIGVSANATSIDAGTAFYMFSGWRSGYPANLDRSQIIVEYRDASGTILSSYNTGSAVFTTWTNSTDNRYAPPGTRTIRIRLISVRVTGTDNDGYYDDISLTTCTAPSSVFIFPSMPTHVCLGTNLVVSGIALPANSNYYYTWVKDGSPITPISNTFTPYSKPITVASDAGIYALKVQDGTSNNAACSNIASTTFLIDPIPVAGTINANQEICIHTSPTPLTGTASTGGVAIKYYKWQQSTSSGGPWTTFQAYNTTSTGIAPSTLSNPTYYRRMDSSGSCYGVPTNTIKVQVNNKAVINSITPILRDTLCVGEDFQLIGNVNTTSQPSLNGGYYFYWRKIQNGIANIATTPSATLTTYPSSPTSAVVLDSGTYYLVVQDGPNATLCKDSLKIVIRVNQAPTSKAIIKSNQELCLNDPATSLTEVKPATGIIIGALSYQWYTTKDTIGTPILSKIPSASNNTSYNPGTPTTTNYYIRKDSVKYCTAIQTNFIKVRVNNKAVINSITPIKNDTLCTGDNFALTASVNTVSQPSLNGGYYFYWRKIQNGIANTATAPSATLTTYPSSPTLATVLDSGTYYLVVQDGPNAILCKDSLKIVIRVNQAPTSKAIIKSNQELCLNDPATALTEVKPATGIIVGALSYQWYTTKDTTGTPILSKIPSASNNTSYNPGTPTTTNYYIRKDSVKYCTAVQTNFVKVRVNNKAIINSITPIKNDTLCVGDNFALTASVNTVSQPSLNGGYYFYWRKIQNGISNIATTPSATLTTYPSSPTSAVVLDSGTYYLVVQDGPNATLCKDSLKIVIRVNQAPTSKAIIKSNQELCLNDPATALTEVKPATGIIVGALSYQWYTTKDTTGTPILSKIPSASNNTSYNPETPTTTNYYIRKDSVKYCTAIQTNFVKVRVNNRTKLDSIRATVNDTLCVSNLDQFQLKGYIDSLTAGKQSINGGFHFTWKQLQEPATTSVVVSATAPYVDYPAQSRTVTLLDSGTYYLIVQDGINATKCLDSMLLKIVVVPTCISITCAAPDFVSIKVSSTSGTTLCAGNTLSLEKDVLTLPSTPPTFGYMYSWVRTNTLGTVVVQGPSSTYQDLVINSATAVDSGRYQLIVKDGTTSPAACSNQSLPISIQIKNAITHASVGSDTIICAGNAVSIFTESISNSGGTGSYSYQWQSSYDNIHFNDISSATNSSYQSPNISNTTYFRRTDHSGTCPTAISNTIVVTTTTGVIAGTIQSVNPTICYNAIPTNTISNVTAPSGGTGGNSSISHQWQRSLDRLNWANIIGATSASYSETNKLTDTTYYRRKDVMGPSSCDSIYTTPVQINVFGTNNPGVISKDTSICAGDVAKIKESTKTTGTINSYQWISYTSKSNSWVIAQGNSTAKEYTTLGLSDTTWYKRVIKTSCGNDTSNSVRIAVISRPIVSAGVDTTVLKNSTIQLNGSVIGSTNYEWNPYTNLNNPSILKPDAKITSTIIYILKAFDPTGKCSSEGVIRVSVKAPLIIPNVITPNGDGVNDTWTIEDMDQYPNASFTIYNRWGNIVWKSTSNAFGWNGTNYRNGEALPQGTYFYILDLKSIDYDEPVTGYIQIIR
jgi:gliding motility-associated-like protein